MRNDHLEKDQPISLYQGHALLISTFIGVGVLTYQRGIAAEVGPDAVWTILVGGLVVALEVYLITRLMQRFQGKHLVQLITLPRSPWIGRVLGVSFLILISLFWLAATAVVTRTFGELGVSAVMPMTPINVIMGTLIGGAALVAGQRPAVIARFNEFLLPILYLPVLLLVVAWVQEGEWENFLPLFRLDWGPFLKGILASTFAFSGFSVLFIYMSYYQQPAKAMRTHLSAVAIITFGYWITMTSAIAVFGPNELKQLLWPTLDLVKQAEVPGQILERMESAVLSIWVVAVFTTLVNLFGAVVDLLFTFFRLNERFRRWLAWGMTPILYGLAGWPADLQELFRWGERLGWLEPMIAVIVAVILLVISWIRGRKGEKGNAPTAS